MKPKSETSNTAMGCLVVIVLFTIAGTIGSCQGHREDEKQRQAEAEQRDKAAKAEAARLAKLTPEQRDVEAKAKAAAAKRAAEEAKQAENTRTAAYACRQFVGRILKDPKSAEWERPWYTDATIDPKGALYEIDVIPRAKNSFGAYVVSRFRCKMLRSGDNWTPLSVKELSG